MNSVKKLSSKDWTLQNINDFLNANSKIVLDKSTESIVKKQREKLEKLLKNKSAPIYGINTGFGSLCNTFIEEKDLEKLQENLIKSHACGIGNPIEDKIVRTLILLKVLSLSKGNSAIRIELLQFLIDLFNKNGVPYIPEFGSLGASGDLAPLSHLSLCILGEGKMKDGEKWIQTKAVLKKKKITPISLKAKEGLALINGTQFSLSLIHIFTQSLNSQKSYSHEFGHLMNARHTNDNKALPGRAYDFIINNKHVATLLDNQLLPRILNYSNPNIMYYGNIATGVSDRFNVCNMWSHGCIVASIFPEDGCQYLSLIHI